MKLTEANLPFLSLGRFQRNARTTTSIMLPHAYERANRCWIDGGDVDILDRKGNFQLVMKSDWMRDFEHDRIHIVNMTITRPELFMVADGTTWLKANIVGPPEDLRIPPLDYSPDAKPEAKEKDGIIVAEGLYSAPKVSIVLWQALVGQPIEISIFPKTKKK